RGCAWTHRTVEPVTGPTDTPPTLTSAMWNPESGTIVNFRSAPALTRTDPAGVIVPPLVAVAVMVRSPMVARPSRNTVRVRLASEPGTIELSHDSRCPSTTIGTPPPRGKLTDSPHVAPPSTPKWTG